MFAIAYLGMLFQSIYNQNNILSEFSFADIKVIGIPSRRGEAEELITSLTF